jgi:hypothetical protein
MTGCGFLPDRFLAIVAFLIPFLAVPVAGQPPHTKFASAVAYDSGGPLASSVAVADLNGDGKLDLVVTNFCQTSVQGDCSNNSGEVAVLLGNGDGTFRPALLYSTGGYWAYSVAIGDFNGDGIPDLAVASWCGTLGQENCFSQEGAVSVLLGKGDGTFRPATVYDAGAINSYAVALGDLNGDGKLDIVVANAGPYEAKLVLWVCFLATATALSVQL